MIDVQHEKAFETDVAKRITGAFRRHGTEPPVILYRQ